MKLGSKFFSSSRFKTQLIKRLQCVIVGSSDDVADGATHPQKDGVEGNRGILCAWSSTGCVVFKSTFQRDYCVWAACTLISISPATSKSRCLLLRAQVQQSWRVGCTMDTMLWCKSRVLRPTHLPAPQTAAAESQASQTPVHAFDKQWKTCTAVCGGGKWWRSYNHYKETCSKVSSDLVEMLVVLQPL